MLRSLVVASGILHAHGQLDSKEDRPNIVYLVVESTDGRAWTRDYQDGAVELPNIKALQDQGVEFQSHYANTPVCCPSRASFWSGRHAHHILHNQKASGIAVDGAWNNFEGLPPNFKDRLDQFLTRENYNVKMSGKFDWTRGAHSENVRLNAWTMYTRFPYNVSLAPGGWTDETDCLDKGVVSSATAPWPEGGTPWADDWKTLNSTTTWIKENATDDPRPFFVYQGMNIVHPSYRTSQYWYDKVNQSKIQIPKWIELEDMHPCDFQSSMLKGCLPSEDIAEDFYTESHRVRIRAVYLAMIAEFDHMVGAYVQAVKDAGKYDNTVFIVTSDHGDMQMEHRQFYKMAAYDASSRVPMVIMDARKPRQAPLVTKAVSQLIDIYPTVLTYAGVPQSKWPALDGQPLQALLENENQHVAEGMAWPQIQDRPDFVVSQFHGDNIAMSWYLVVHDGFKLVVWGTGEHHPHQLFDLTADVNEDTNLVDDPAHADRLQLLLTKLNSVVDFAAVSKNVAKYNYDSMKYWTENTDNWQDEMGKASLRWSTSWNQNAEGAVAAVEEWLAKPPAVEACRSERAWPPPSQVSLV